MTHYWNNKIKNEDTLYLTAINNNLIITVKSSFNNIIFKPTNNPCIDDTWYLGLMKNNGYLGIEDLCLQHFKQYNGHCIISLDFYENLLQTHNNYSFTWPTETVLAELGQFIRSKWICNKDLPEHENKLFSYLGMKEFYASKHILISKYGSLFPN
jgi:hypothetical protein